MHPKNLSIADYTYNLPDERIAAFPLPERDASKLLVYRDATITEDNYRNIANYLPADSLLIFNNTRVIQARLLFTKNTGGVIEIFCLEPHGAIKDYSTIFLQKEKVQWKCLVGGAAKWKQGLVSVPLKNNSGILTAQLIEKLSDAYIIEFAWQPVDLSFAEVIEQAGDLPLPPYIKRKTDLADKERYQTIYAEHEGSVATPTAGLHFTDNIFKSFDEKKIDTGYVTLHVGAGTFKPVKADVMEQHDMHGEWLEITTTTLQQLISHDTVVAVGTTSLRTIESLYWMGVKLSLTPDLSLDNLTISQWEVYEAPLADTTISSKEALTVLLERMTMQNYDRVFARTSILIAPGYTFRIAKAIVTNFHQPHSTLLLLVAAAIGNDWKKVYDYALKNEFRFLSYGDGSLLLLQQ